jgi:DNA-binding GntR family transcriptional regulator
VNRISDLPMLNDMDADYSPQYVKLARVLREKIKSGELGRFTLLPASHLAAEYDVSIPVAYAALGMLAANRYVGRPEGTRSYYVVWDTAHPGSLGV